MNLSATVSVVTGGTSGIGHAIVHALAERGSRVAFCGRSDPRVSKTADEFTALGLDVLGIACDVRDPTSISQFVSDVRKAYGAIDILVNNAGLAYIVELIELTDDQLHEMFEVNVSGVFRMTREVLPEMLARGSGTIVNIASLVGKNGMARGTAYAATKHAVMGFSRSLMLEVRQKGVRVVAICPGSVKTDFFESAGMEIKNPQKILQASDVADTVMAALTLPDRALISELDVRPASP